MPWYGWIGLIVVVILFLTFPIGRLLVMVSLLLLVGAFFGSEFITLPLSSRCDAVDNPFTGAQRKVPYKTLISIKEQQGFYALIRPIGPPNASARCIWWKEELPRKFFVGSDYEITPLTPSQ